MLEKSNARIIEEIKDVIINSSKVEEYLLSDK